MFRLVKILNGRTNQGEPIKLPSTPEESYFCGEALSLIAGKLTKCAPTAKPDFICCEDYTAPASDNRAVTAEPVSAEMIFEVSVSASPASLVAGSKVTLHTDALNVTATVTNGVATVIDTCGAKEAGDRIQVSFK